MANSRPEGTSRPRALREVISWPNFEPQGLRMSALTTFSKRIVNQRATTKSHKSPSSHQGRMPYRGMSRDDSSARDGKGNMDCPFCTTMSRWFVSIRTDISGGFLDSPIFCNDVHIKHPWLKVYLLLWKIWICPSVGSVKFPTKSNNYQGDCLSYCLSNRFLQYPHHIPLVDFASETHQPTRR